MTNPSGPDQAAPASKTSLWEDFIDIFHSPSAVFARRENAGFWVPLIVVTLVLGGLFFANSGLLQPLMDAEFQRQTAAMMRKNPNITAEQIARMRSFGETFSKIGVLIFVPLGIFVNGLFLWLVGKAFEAKESLRTAVVVAAYASIPRVLEAVLAGVQGLVLDTSSMKGFYSLSLGVGRFLNPDTTSPVILALLGRIDVFSIWVTILLGIGLSVTGRIPRSRAMLAAAGMWVIGALPALLPALRS